MNTVADVHELARNMREQLDRVVIGQSQAKEYLLACLFAGGHALLEGVPGTAKTLLALTMARLLGCTFRRIQFTPDLMPIDLLGTNIFNQKEHEFSFLPGPVFTDVLLADEINRTPPRTQSALLEAMQERAVTIDGIRHALSPAFFVCIGAHFFGIAFRVLRPTDIATTPIGVASERDVVRRLDEVADDLWAVDDVGVCRDEPVPEKLAGAEKRREDVVAFPVGVFDVREVGVTSADDVGFVATDEDDVF
jgi:hypothetical protein